MPIGTSLGAFYEDEFTYQARKFLKQNKQEDGVVSPKNDKTESDVNVIPPSVKTEDFITQVGYIGELGVNDNLSYDRSEVGVNKPMSPAEAKERSKKFPGEETYTLPDNPYLFIRTPIDPGPAESVPMS